MIIIQQFYINYHNLHEQNYNFFYCFRYFISTFEFYKHKAYLCNMNKKIRYALSNEMYYGLLNIILLLYVLHYKLISPPQDDGVLFE